MDVIGQDAVGVAQDPRVLVHPGEELLAVVVAGSREGEACGEPASPLFQPLDAQELGAEGALSAAALPGTEESDAEGRSRVRQPTQQEQFMYGGVDMRISLP